MKDVRLNLTENEKIAQSIVGLESNSSNFSMAENSIQNIIDREKTNKFNDMVDSYVDRITEHTNAFKEATEQLSYDISKLEIKPMFGRVIMTIFPTNPFQRITTTKSGIITDMGGLNPQYKNTDSGEMEEAEERILVGVVQEVGPDCIYVKEGDTIFFDKASARPIPFYKQGFWTMSEQQIIAIVNEGLEKRFNDIKNGRK